MAVYSWFKTIPKLGQVLRNTTPTTYTQAYATRLSRKGLMMSLRQWWQCVESSGKVGIYITRNTLSTHRLLFVIVHFIFHCSPLFFSTPKCQGGYVDRMLPTSPHWGGCSPPKPPPLVKELEYDRFIKGVVYRLGGGEGGVWWYFFPPGRSK